MNATGRIWVRNEGSGEIFFEFNKDGERCQYNIAVINKNLDDCKSITNLFSAAPDMYELLQDMKNGAEFVKKGIKVADYLERIQEILDRANGKSKYTYYEYELTDADCPCGSGNTFENCCKYREFRE